MDSSTVDIQEKLQSLKTTSSKCLFLLLLNTLTWLGGSVLFMFLEGGTEEGHKCGVKRVQRDFIDILWQESQLVGEMEWKSSARSKLVKMENQLIEAVEAGVGSSTNEKSWGLANTFVYCLTLATTIGYGHQTPSQPISRVLSLVYGCVAIPLMATFLMHLANMFHSVFILVRMKSPSCSFLSLVLFHYGLIGCLLFSLCYSWDLLDSLYFVFSSLSTVGFGDVKPEDSLTFLLCGGYLLVGLAVFSLWQTSAVEWLDERLDKVQKWRDGGSKVHTEKEHRE